ncbi:caskin-1-like isoform X2 [Panonychus citri]|nr:caskin-1-like isoform X2 [Panonychus citri]XP_053204011.1 caskin-1-like isoform X2 [Panonychus citri]
MRRKGTFKWSFAKKIPSPVAPVEFDVAGSQATIQRRSNNLKTSFHRHSLSSTNSEEESIILNVLPTNDISLETWLTTLQFEQYIPLFTNAGYDMPTVSRMTPADLSAIGITKPLHRQIIKASIAKLNIPDGLPSYVPKSLLEWLKLIHLEEYFEILCQQGYDSVDRAIELTWEDYEEIGIKKLGHQKKLSLAIKRIQDLNNGVRRSTSNILTSVPSSSSLCSESISLYPDTLSLPLMDCPPISQKVAIKTSIGFKITSTVGSSSTPELTTFQKPLDNNTMKINNHIKK